MSVGNDGLLQSTLDAISDTERDASEVIYDQCGPALSQVLHKSVDVPSSVTVRRLCNVFARWSLAMDVARGVVHD